MKASVAVAKEADAKKGVSPTKSGDSIPRLRDEPERQLGSLRSVIGNIRRDGGTPSVESIATELSGMYSAERAPALLALQRTHGNQYVQRVVAGIQAKLVVGQPGDKYEQEADRVADAVMRMPDPRVQRPVEPEKEEEEKIRTKQLPSQTLGIVPDVETSINSIRGGGQPLPESTRAFFEPRFDYDFSQVRVHTDAKADALNRSLNARAFTAGQDLFFQQGDYNPSSSGGRKLLAHELTHVVQQTERQLQRQALVSQFGWIGGNQYLQMTNGNVMSISGQGRPNTRIERIDTGRFGWGGVSEGVLSGFTDDDSYVRFRVVATPLGFGSRIGGPTTSTDAIRGELYVGVRVYDFRDNKTFNDEFASNIALYKYFRIQNGNVVMDPTERLLSGEVEGGKLTIQTGLINRGPGTYMCVVNVKYQKEQSGGENLTLTAGPVQGQWGTITGNREIMRGYVATNIHVRQP